jgi:hypothetical protein
MQSIDSQIKTLLLKKKKIDYINYLLDLIKNDTKCIDFTEVKQEVMSQIEPFFAEVIASIETGTDIAKSVSNSFSNKEVEVLQNLVQRTLAKQSNPAPQTETTQKPIQPTRNLPELSQADKLSFALANRHFANKRVQIINDQNVQINGVCVGLDAPNVLVRTDSGPTIQVPLEKIVIS